MGQQQIHMHKKCPAVPPVLLARGGFEPHFRLGVLLSLLFLLLLFGVCGSSVDVSVGFWAFSILFPFRRVVDLRLGGLGGTFLFLGGVGGRRCVGLYRNVGSGCLGCRLIGDDAGLRRLPNAGLRRLPFQLCGGFLFGSPTIDGKIFVSIFNGVARQGSLVFLLQR